MTDIFRNEYGGELRKLGLGPGLEHSSGSRFGNREGCFSDTSPSANFPLRTLADKAQFA